MSKGIESEVNKFWLTDLDKLVAIHVLKRGRDVVDAEVEIGLQEPFSDFVRKFQPTRSMDDAMEAAKAIGLFDRYALHSGTGVYSQDYHWFVSEIDQRGVLQGYVAAKVDSMAVTLACLQYVSVEIPSEIRRSAKEVCF